MAVYLVAHARARPSATWEGVDAFRPLQQSGRRQAEALIGMLEGRSIARVLACPVMRCLETVEPLAASRDLELDSDPRLGEPDGVEHLLARIDAERGEGLVVCVPGDLCERLIAALGARGVSLPDSREAPEGSVWELREPGSPGPCAVYHPPPELPREAVPRIALLEVGSTSVQLVVYERSEGAIEAADRRRILIADGRLMLEDGRIPEGLCVRAIDAAQELAALAGELGVEHVLAVGHSMLREARNGRDLARRIGERTGTPVRVLSGDEEARLLFAAIQERVELGGRAILCFDLGGGGLHVAVGGDEGVLIQRTLPLGVVRLRQLCAPDDPPTPAQASVLRERVWTEVSPHLSAISRATPSRCVATGGTIAALGRLAGTSQDEASLVAGRILSRSDLEALERGLLEGSLRPSTADADGGRAALLPTAAVVLGALADAVGLVGLTLCDWGVREGVVLDALR